MNRSLLIPAGLCAFAFAALVAAFHGFASDAQEVGPAQLVAIALRARRASPPIERARMQGAPRSDNGKLSLSVQEAEQVLAGLAAEYIRPWQKRQASPHHLYSRVGPRFIPSISATVEIASGDLVRSDNFLMATVTIDKGAEPERIPCVVDRKTADVHFFAENRWLTQAAWLERAPLP